MAKQISKQHLHAHTTRLKSLFDCANIGPATYSAVTAQGQIDERPRKARTAGIWNIVTQKGQALPFVIYLAEDLRFRRPN